MASTILPARRTRRSTFPVRAAWLLVLLWALAPARSAWAGADPTLEWYTMTTPHFYVHFWKREYAVALRVARVAEAAHEQMIPVLGWTPRDRTHIVLTDEVDSANGSATVLPLNVIRLFVTAPEPSSTLNDFDDWLLGLIIHEYAHILHLDHIRGLPRGINALFGKVYSPNQLQPRWFIEGLATFQETIRTSGGRQRNSIFDMWLRMAVLEGRFQRIDQVSHGTIAFPGGNAWYLYGSSFLRYLAERFGENALAALSKEYGGRVIPFSINRVARKVLGKTFLELWDDWRVLLERRYRRLERRLRKEGLTPTVKLTRRGERVARPSFTADGKEILYNDDSGRDRVHFARVPVDGSRPPRAVARHFGGYPAPVPGKDLIVYQQNEVYRTYYYYDDLFVWDGRRKSFKQLTFGRRAREPHVSPDGKRVAFTVNELGTSSLAVADLVDGPNGVTLENLKILYRGEAYTQVATPAWSPDGKEIAYSAWETGGYRDIHIYDLTTGRDRTLFKDRAIELDPRYSPDGRFLYFVSDRTGIYNLYAYERKTGALFQATSVLGGVFQPDISPDGRKVAFVGFNSYGYDIYVADLDPARFRPALPFIDDRPAVQQIQSEVVYPVRPYSALPTVRPFRWTLGLGADGFGQALTLHTHGGDVAGWHYYAIDAVLGFTRGDAQFAASYTYGRLWPDLNLGVARSIGPRGGFVLDGVAQTYIEETYGLAAGTTLPILRSAAASADLTFNYNLSWYRAATGLSYRPDPFAYLPSLPEIGRHATLSFGASYNSSRGYQYSISPEEGRSIGVGVRLGHPLLGGEFRTAEITYSWTEYFRPPWYRFTPQHAFAFRYGGGFGTGDLRRRGLFYISGFPEQDVLKEFFFGGRVGGATLRGYPYGFVYGDQYHLLNLEYRFPIVTLERGIQTVPIYLRRIHGAVFGDVGNAFFGSLDPAQLKTSAGFQLTFETLLGYVQDARLIVGYARGFQDQGIHQTYVFVGFPF